MESRTHHAILSVNSTVLKASVDVVVVPRRLIDDGASSKVALRTHFSVASEFLLHQPQPRGFGLCVAFPLGFHVVVVVAGGLIALPLLECACWTALFCVGLWLSLR